MSTEPVTVRRSIEVEAPREHVFEVFTRRFNEWWPRSHHIGTREVFTAVMEPRVGGRWYERGDDGTECDWGSVLEWEPPRRVVLAWCLDPEWHYDPDEETEVEVTFTAEGRTRTRVDLVHRGLERFAGRAAGLAEALGSDGGWTGLLAAMRAHAERVAAAATTGHDA